ncbi:MAG: hypothetical protein K6E30_05710 [Lachnospiraceae bacterium]|nr:hypothetical protein [Lachnospiraceae bacterium]
MINIFYAGMTAAVLGVIIGMIFLTVALIKPVGFITVRNSGLILMASLFLGVACITAIIALAR